MINPFAMGPMMMALAMGPLASAPQTTMPWLTLTLSISMPEDHRQSTDPI